jgi:hypothetical protein
MQSYKASLPLCPFRWGEALGLTPPRRTAQDARYGSRRYLQLTFVKDEGRVTHMDVVIDGETARAKRIK